MLVIVVFVLLFGAYLQWWWKRRRMLELAAKIPEFPGGLPLLGHAHKVFGTDSSELLNFIIELSDEANRNDGITSAWFNMRPHFLPTWLHHRRLLNPAFSPQVLNTFQGVFNKQARKLSDGLAVYAEGKEFDAGAIIGFTFLETIYETAFGISPDGETSIDQQFNEACHKLLGIIIRRFLNSLLHFDFIYNWTSMKREEDKLIKVLHNTSSDIIEKRKLQFLHDSQNNNNDDTGKRFKPFLQLILELTATKGAFNDKDIREEVDTMLVAGQDTSALVLQYIFLTLGSYPKVQEKVYEEMSKIFEDSDRDVTKDDLCRMTYTEAVINETIRLYPIGTIIARDVDKDVEISQYTLPAGSTVFVSFWGIHRGPEWGPDAAAFRPERWLEPNTLPDLHAAFGGFSIGKRMCIGKAYAMLTLKTSLAHLIRRYRITADHTRLRLKLDFMLRPASGHYITIERR
ncbi:cytochrome P450 4C1-like [Pectinophora gossypiella]|uniref:cytochrome P450 4C1-like n=1 Tax=Pectinophora gossypiella TaxID=13191 RepID=UPI00214F4CA5|nr:cytochrome P450 4C1-like [Pectinophora gossypiella]